MRGWDGVMQSYYVDEWEPQRILLEATFTPLAFGGAWLQGTGREHQRAMLDFGHVGSIGVHLSDESRGRIRLASDGSLTRHLQAHRRATRIASASASPAPPKSTSPPAPPRSTPTSPARECSPQTASPISKQPASSLVSCASRPSTRWAPPGFATEAEGVCAPDGSVNGINDLYIADASLFPTSVGVNPMMTVIAFANQIASKLAQKRDD